MPSTTMAAASMTGDPGHTSRPAIPKHDAAEEGRDHRSHRKERAGPSVQTIQYGLLLGDRAQALLVGQLVACVVRFLSAGRLDFAAHPGSDFRIVPDVGRSGDVAAFCAALAP